MRTEILKTESKEEPNRIKKPVVFQINTADFTRKDKLKGEVQTFGEKAFARLYDALWNYIFLDYKRKDNLIKVISVNEDNEPCFAYMTAAELMIHMIFWKPYVIYAKCLKRKVVIRSDTFYNTENFDKKKFATALKNIVKTFLPDAEVRGDDGINELSYIISLCVDDYCELMNSYCTIASNTISIYDIHQLEKRSPEFKSCLNTQLDEELPQKVIEQQIKKGEHRTIDAILKDGKSALVNYIKGGRLSKDQFTQMFFAVGPRTDVDKSILPKIIKGNFMKGYSCPSDAYMDAITGRDAQILKHITVRDSGYLSRKINLDNLNTTIDYNVKDCGTTHTISYFVETADHLQSIDLKYIVKDNGKLYLVHAAKDTDLIGQTVRLRSHIVCALERGKVCMTCFGEKAKRLRGTNIGGLPAIKFANPISKRLMRAKHFTTANSVDVKSEFLNKYFNEEGRKLYFKPEMKNKDVFICVDRDIIEDIASGATDTEDELIDSSSPIESIVIQDGDDRYTIECEGLFLVLTDEVLEETSKFVMGYDSEEAMIPVSKFDNDVPFFNMIVVSEAVQLYLKQIKRIIDSSKSKTYSTPDALMKDISDVLIDMGIAGTSSINIETLIYQMVRSNDKLYERPDFSKSTPDKTIIPLSSSISNSDIYTAFGFEKIKQQVTNVDSFLKKGSGIYDPLFKVHKADYLIPVEKSTILKALSK